MITHKSSIKAIREHFRIDPPAKGMRNLARSTRDAIQRQHERRIERIRLKLRMGKDVTATDLELE